MSALFRLKQADTYNEARSQLSTRIKELNHSADFNSYVVSNVGYDSSQAIACLQNSRKLLRESERTESFASYCDFIHELRELQVTDIVPLKDLMNTISSERRLISLRYDIDMDHDTALRMARYNARYGICGSFFILHTAYYYGMWKSGVFCRNPDLSQFIRELIVTGCEIGLHTDPLSIYIEHGVDGATALQQELDWLRSQGARVYGTVAHNSFPVYGAENFEVFKGRVIGSRSHLVYKDRSVPLGLLNEQELGLTYEGNYPLTAKKLRADLISEWTQRTDAKAVLDEDWMKTYLLQNPCFQRCYDAVVWNHGNGRWTFARTVPATQNEWGWQLTVANVISKLMEMPHGTRSVIVIHPINFSAEMF